MPELQLLYDFAPTPALIRASVGGANPNTVDLAVTINPPGIESVTLRQIQLQIPVGANVAGDLSDASNLPEPTGVQGADGWTVSRTGSVVTLLGAHAGTAIDGPITFTLAGIAVNETEGTVPITVTEYRPSGRKVSDGNRYWLFKHPADFPISAFWADPAALYDLDQTVTIHWTCTDQGADCDYALSPGDWGNCLEGGECFACGDGQQGITSGPLQETTTFTLQAISGGEPVFNPLELNVPVLIPSFSQVFWVGQNDIAGGQILDLHWLAFNAGYCSVWVDQALAVEHAPADTFRDGFRMLLEPGTHPVQVVAHALEGTLTVTLHLGELTAEAGIAVAVPAPPLTLAVSADSSTAWVGGGLDPSFTSIELASPTTWSGTQFLPDSGPPLLSADGTVVAQTDDATLIINSSPALKEQLYFVIVQNFATTCGCFTLDDAYFLGGRSDGTLGRVPTTEFQPTPEMLSLGGIATAVVPAVAADGTALVLAALPEAVKVVDVEVMGVTATIEVAGVTAIATSADGAVAVAVANGKAIVIDLADHAALPGEIEVGAGPWAVALSPDGTLAFVANGGDATLTVIDLLHHRAVGAIAVPAAQPSAVAVSADGTRLVVACQGSSNVVVYPPAAQTSSGSG